MLAFIKESVVFSVVIKGWLEQWGHPNKILQRKETVVWSFTELQEKKWVTESSVEAPPLCS